MNVLAAEPGWRNLAIWALPPVAYALASDTGISVVRAWAIARHRHLGTAPAADAPTPLVILGGLALWLLRRPGPYSGGIRSIRRLLGQHHADQADDGVAAAEDCRPRR